MFEGPRDLVRQYESLVGGQPNANSVATGEIIRLLDQLELIIAMVRERERQTTDAFTAAGTDEASLKGAAASTFRLLGESHLLAEAFYYFAFAIVNLVRKEHLPHLGAIHAKDVAVIRNKLLAHYKPDPAAPFGRVGTTGGSRGPAFAKYGRDTGGALRTGGLFDDGEAFARAVWSLFESAIQRVRSPQA